MSTRLSHTEPELDTIRVLHVDDDPDLADLAATFLKREDDRFSIQIATSATEGLDRLAEDAFDCIISDYDMPGQNGIQFLDTVREEYPNLPFILFTGKGSEEIASEAISAGVTDYLQKGGGSEQYELLANRILNAVDAYRSQQLVQERTRGLETLISNLPGIVYRCRNDPEWPMETVMGEVENLTGYTADALEDDDDVLWGEEILHPDDRDPMWEIVQEGLAEDGAFEVTYRIVTKDGTTKWMWERGRGVYTDGGELEALEGFITEITERKEREQELNRTAARLEALFENSPDMINVHDTDGTIIDPNPRLCEAIGYDAAELTGMKVWDLDQAMDPDEACDLWEGMDVGDRHRLEAVYQRKDGSSFPVEVHIQRLRVDGQDRFIVIGRDVTERNEREQHLEEERAFSQVALDSVLDFYWILDPEGYVVDWNDEDGDVTGYSPDEAIGMHTNEFFPEYEQEYIAEKIEKLRETGDITAQADFRMKNGDLVPYRFDGTILTDSEGQVERMGGFGQDISDRIERERELREEQEFTEQVIDTIPDIFYILGTDGIPQRWNQRVPEITGYSDEELAEMQVTELFSKENQSRVTEAIEEVLTTGQAIVEADLRTATDEYIPYELTGGRLHNTEGELVGLVGIGRDITERKEYEEELEQKNEQLEEFASIVSHDLRNPLNVAEGRLELAREECDSEHLDSMARACERMNTLIDDLLTLAREGEHVSDTESVALADLFETCWRNVETANATIRTPIDRTIQADRSRLAQLLENLIRNAVEHGDDDVIITVGELADGFYVEDDGPGIPGDERDEVFDAGYSTTEDGTGFGLSIVKQVANAHGWNIRVTEGSDGGARFEITGLEFAK